MPDASNKIKTYLELDLSKWEKITLKDTIKLENIEPIFERIK